jgi:hypothetical protein
VTTRDGFGIDREKPLEKKNRIWTVGFCRCCFFGVFEAISEKTV